MNWFTVFGSASVRTRANQAEEEAIDDEFLIFDDDEETVMHAYLASEGESSQRGRDPNAAAKKICKRDHASGHANIMRDYFNLEPVFTEYQFRRRFRMHRYMVQRLVSAVEANNPYFQQRVDATGKLGLSCLQKVVASLRILARGGSPDNVDEYVRIGESTARESLVNFCQTIIHVFGGQYLRAPTREDVDRLLRFNARRGFPGMLGSIDCMHWEWRNCPTAWKGMYTGRGKTSSMILEAVASHDLWIWHAYFGMPGSCNDINVLHRSPLFDTFLSGDAPNVTFSVNDHTYNMGYYLADGIYPEWPAFVKTVRHPTDLKSKHFAQVQEGARKDIERAFGVLQARWGIIRGPALSWNREHIRDIITTCIILHNMIIEDEKELAGNIDFDGIGDQVDFSTTNHGLRHSFVQGMHKLRDKNKHNILQYDLIEHNWMRHGGA